MHEEIRNAKNTAKKMQAMMKEKASRETGRERERMDLPGKNEYAS